MMMMMSDVQKFNVNKNTMTILIPSLRKLGCTLAYIHSPIVYRTSTVFISDDLRETLNQVMRWLDLEAGVPLSLAIGTLMEGILSHIIKLELLEDESRLRARKQTQVTSVKRDGRSTNGRGPGFFLQFHLL